MDLIFKRSLLVCFLFAHLLAWGQDADSESQYESLDMSMTFDRTYRITLPTLYAVPDVVMLPVAELFDFLKIPNKVSADGQVITGFFENETNSFEINNLKKFVTFKGQNYPFTKDESTTDIGILYLRTTVFKRAFGFDMAFNDRSLSIQFTSSFELPLFKLMKLEKQRENLRISGSEAAVYDTVLKRDYHWYRGQMIDWSVASMQSSDSKPDTRMEIGGGAELLGGETNIWVNYSTQYGFKRNQQQYYWRWADNNAKLMRQFQIGRIGTPSITSVLSPVDGFMFTNAMTTIRKALGNYTISNYTDPDWVVELYLNNQLISYTRADATGFYSFKVPIVYGSSNIVLRFYGPSGEIRSEQKVYNMPFNLMPKGEFEYKVSGGTLLDTSNARFAKAEFNYGMTRTLTLGGGVEYLSSIPTHPEVPFLNLTYQPISQLLLTGEYAHNVRSKVTMNYSFPKNIVFDLTYANYVPGQEAIIYNYLEERSASLSVPMRFRNVTSSIRASFRQNVYEDFAYSSGELMWTNNYRNYSMILTNYANTSAANALNLYGNLTLAAKLRKELNVRTSAQYNYLYKQLISLRLEVDKRLFANGHGALKVENNFLTNSQSVGLTFRYELPYMTTNASASLSNTKIQISEGASGSFALNSGGKYVHTDRRNAVGRSGISIQPFIDMNFNGKRDENEPFTKGLRVRSSGGQVLQRDQDSIIRVVGLEPFVDYTLTLDESGFDNVSLRVNSKSMKVTTDPNQFKLISLPVVPMAEIYGMVADETGKGIGRIIVRIADKSGKMVAKVLTESDGYFNYIGFKPGDYKVFVDSLQLEVLKFQASPVFATVLENAEGDVVDAGTIELVKKRTAQTRRVRKALAGGGFEEVEEPIANEIVEPPVVVKQEAIEEDTLALFTILFDVDKTKVKSMYLQPLQKLANYLNKPNHNELGVDIQGHTDSDANERYNLYLSNNRAEAVKQVLVKEGVRPDRLKTSAFGKGKLLNTSSNAAEKALNRRVIFKPIRATEEAEKPLELEVRKYGPSNVAPAAKDVVPEVRSATKPERKDAVRSVIAIPTELQIKAPEKNKEKMTDTPAVKQQPLSKTAPNPAAQKSSAYIAQQIGVALNGENAIQVDGGLPSLCTNVPSWCIMYTSSGRYWYQVGTYKSLPEAMEVAKQLKQVLNGKINFVMMDNSVRIQVGNYQSQAVALQDARSLYSKGLIK
jgi:outer membrane protein OmpA-like peptidoglycan-associated protein